MQRVLANWGSWTFIWVGVYLAASSGQPAGAQEAREHALLPPAFGGTPASYQLHALGAYLVAQGDLAESMAIARKINAEAVALEMENWVNYVDAYFERREKWREWRRKENPNYLERQRRREDVIKRQIEDNFHNLVKGDLTKHLNWLLTKLSGPMTYRYFSGDEAFVDWVEVQKVHPDDMALVRFSAGGLEFPATEPKVLASFWPPGLRGPEFEAERTRFEEARENLLGQIRSEGQASHETEDELTQALNALFVALDEAYTPEDRKEASVSLTYHEARHHLRSLLLQKNRVVRTSDQSVLDGRLCFQGETLLDLIQHMYETGLVFAPPEPGGERVYQGLMNSMREVYMTLGSEE